MTTTTTTRAIRRVDGYRYVREQRRCPTCKCSLIKCNPWRHPDIEPVVVWALYEIVNGRARRVVYAVAIAAPPTAASCTKRRA